jgi:hypothetical protein
MHHIRNTLPDIKARIGQQLAKYQSELAALGGAMGETNPGSLVLSTITEFCSEFRSAIDGNTNDPLQFFRIDTIVVCGYDSFRGYCQAANQEVGGTGVEVLYFGLR